MNTLTERRAKFVYEGARLAAIAAQMRQLIVPVSWEEREEPFKAQFREVIERQCGEQRSKSPKELHGSWMQAYFSMGWVYGEKYDREKKTHPDLIPYENLDQREKDKDAVFIALCEIARKWIRGELKEEKFDKIECGCLPFNPCEKHAKEASKS
ncbi:MAG: RyR domain-containing protein [Candidatus Omnitrophota bacterium]